MSQLFGMNSKQNSFLRRNSAPSMDDSFFSTTSSEGTNSTLFGSVEPTTAIRTHQHRLNAAQEQRTYRDSCHRLMNHIQAVSSICSELKESNMNKHPIYYPFLQKKPVRSQTLDLSRPVASPMSDFNILSLDLKMGRASTDLSSLEPKSIASLLNDRFDQSLNHLEKLHTRIADTSSKVLVTGDLNSGKSTFVNALLKREILPVDQQPCTSIFTEVLDAMLNDGLEQIHAIPVVENYNRLDPDTYHVIEMRHLYKVITDEYDTYKMLKIYANDARTTQESLLHNGVVDIALIDSPGLNTDSIKTTAVFARQEEIDVVVFVVSAENHFTLSGKEFLWNAANEKTHIFIVVNRFDSIRDKERCKRLILEQIRQLSPATYADADDLVHFVSAGNVDLEPGSRTVDAPDFARLEQRLRSFVLENRTRSKLMPAKTYLAHLLTDIKRLAETNTQRSSEAFAQATMALEQDLPAYQHLLSVRDRLLTSVERQAESTVMAIQSHVRQTLTTALDQIKPTIEYPGILLIWQYAQDLADSMMERMLETVRQEEGHTRHQVDLCLERLHAMGTEHLGAYERAPNTIKSRERRVTISVEATDFFDLAVDDKGAALSIGAAAMVGGRLLGFRDALTSVSCLMGSNRRWLMPALGVATVGLVVYVVSDMRNAVERKLVMKFKDALRESGYVESQAGRLGRDSRKVLRVEGWEIQSRIQKAIEDKESHRQETEENALAAKETAEYFASVLEKSSLLLEKVETVPTDNAIKESI